VTLRLLYLAAATTLATPIAVASASTDIGRPVAQVLREAESSGIRVIFTDQSVPPNMRVSVDSRVSEPVEHLREILRPHRLALEEVTRGVYVVDCSSYVDRLLQETYPDAYSSLVSSSGTYKPTTQHYYNFIRGLSNESDDYWNRVSNASNLQPGDILVFRKKNHYGNLTQGHIMIVMDKPTRDEDQDVYYIRVADSAPSGHSEDTRPPHVSGIGIGTLLLKVNPRGEPLAYAWKMGAHWESRVTFAMARPVGETSDENAPHYFKTMA